MLESHSAFKPMFKKNILGLSLFQSIFNWISFYPLIDMKPILSDLDLLLESINCHDLLSDFLVGIN